MSFLTEYDAKKDCAEKYNLLYEWILNRRDELFEELRKNRPIFKFCSRHPGNPEIPNAPASETQEGYAYLLTRSKDVKAALSGFSMRPYERDSKGRPYILSEARPDVHQRIRAIMYDALQVNQGNLSILIQKAVDDTWNERAWISNNKNQQELDVRAYVRRAALRFTGYYFGIPEFFIFHDKTPPADYKAAIANFETGLAKVLTPSTIKLLTPTKIDGSELSLPKLEFFSLIGYEQFIWKIHARHFVDLPDNESLKVIAGIVKFLLMAPTLPPNTVIGRIKKRIESFEGGRDQDQEAHAITNIVGAIQGLVDNVLTGACYALNQMIKQSQEGKDPKPYQYFDQLRGLTANELIATIREIHKRDTPSPFLPRFGDITELPSYKDDSVKKYLDSVGISEGENIACAIGAAWNDEEHDGSDIRLGYGMHECIGRDIGDEIKARALAKILNLPDLAWLENQGGLEKQFGWIVEIFNVKIRFFGTGGTKSNDPPNELEHIDRNRFLIDYHASATKPRPRPYSLWSTAADSVIDYSAWQSLNDRGYFSRHLPPTRNGANGDKLPPLESQAQSKTLSVIDLFNRQKIEESRSSLLFTFFAQWLTDSFLRTNLNDRRKTSSNHQIDMCQIYGLNERTTRLLRTGVNGRLKIENIGEGFPPRLFTSDRQVKTEFLELPYVKDGTYHKILSESPDPESRKDSYFATGLERGNSNLFYAALSTLFLREHNRLCEEIKIENGNWDDERIFQTARNIITVLEIKIVIEEYISHINGNFKYTLDHTIAESKPWYRTNWIALEFDLLYRWHSLVPDEISLTPKVPNTAVGSGEFRINNKPLLSLGLPEIFKAATQQPAGQIGLFNTPKFLIPAELNALKMSRQFRVQPYNQYRKQFGLTEIRSFDQIPANDFVRAHLENVYKDINQLEFLVGLYGESAQPNSNGKSGLFGDLMSNMVAYDAVTHALTNPLLSRNTFNAETFSEVGWKTIHETTCLKDLLARNCSNVKEALVASFDYEKVN